MVSAQRLRDYLYKGARQRRFYHRPSKKLPPEVIAKRNKSARETTARIHKAAEELALVIEDTVAAKASELNVDPDRLVLALGRRSAAIVKTRKRANPFNGFIKLKSDGHNEGEHGFQVVGSRN